ncbi:DUF6966 domain-containing protein [Agromyces sp. GXS1127]|uniref:DUF6966 domain-containing protein n=1 Tax=Agromyces sp. GXS1127 TaxID=3424181 RepID=UPI003D312306
MPHAQLRAALLEMSTLLEGHGESNWSEWARRTADLAADDGFDPSIVRRAFGGMGSLNDLIIHPVNGHIIDLAEVDSVNEKLASLRSDIYAASLPQ